MSNLERQEANRLRNEAQPKMLLCKVYKVIQSNKNFALNYQK